MPLDVGTLNIEELPEARFEITEHIAAICCCTDCSNDLGGHNHGPDISLDLYYAIGDNQSEIQNQYGKPSYDWDQAAVQLTRWEAKWDDDDLNGGVPGNAIGTPGTVTFGFLANPNDLNARAMTLDEITRTLEAINEFEEVSQLSFERQQTFGSEYVLNESLSEIDFQAEEGTNGGYATPFWQDGTLQTSTVHIGTFDHDVYGSWAYKTTIHEIGHAVGLPHPGDYNGAGAGGYVDDAEYAEDTYMYTVMSYFSHTYTGGDTFESVVGPGGATAQIGGYATGLLLHDIAALQYLYGANYETRAGDTVYGFNSTEATSSHWHLSDWQDFFVAAIWDGGGNDTIDASGYYEDQIISLIEESFSSLGGLTYNLSIARGVIIENAIGGFGDDRLVGNSENNILDGGGGLDTVDYSAANTGINLNLSASTFTAVGVGTDTLISIEGVVATNFDDVLVGTDGDNFFEMLGGNDTITGGLGTDWISLRGATTGVTISSDTLSSGSYTADGLGTNTFSGIEGIEGTDFADTFYGDENQQFYRGGRGDDVFIVSAGSDSYDGGAGLDTLDLRASTSGVEIHMGTGSVYVSGSFGAFTQENFEHTHMTNFDDWVNGTSDDNIIYTYDGDDEIYAQQGDDYVDSGTGNDIISVWYGDDTVFAGDGDDEIDGGFGDDTLNGGAGADTINGGDGNDTASYSSAASGVIANLATGGSLGDAEGDTFQSIENLTGSSFEDTLIGNFATNTLFGGDGDDVLEGRGGGDIIDGGHGFDFASYANASGGVSIDLSNDAYQFSDAEGDTLENIEGVIGSDFDDFLIGDFRSNTLIGGEGNDALEGMEGNNTLTGGAGSDTFIFKDDTDFGSNYSSNITDFNHLEDLIDFSGFATYAEADATFLSATNQNGNAVLIMPSGSTLTLIGVNAADLQRSNFVFPANGANIEGDDGDNILNGSDVDNVINGYGGNDLLSGMGGSDTLNGGDGNDVLNGGDAPDVSASQGFVYRLYLATLGREADATGLKAWVESLESGANTNASVAAGFVASIEFQETYGSLDNTEFVTLLYNNVLNRDPDPAGLQGWLDALDNGSSRSDVVIGFTNSAEFISNMEYPALGYFSELNEGNLGAIFRAYGAVLDRSPDQQGFLTWVDVLDSGSSNLQEVIDGFTGSQEFQVRYGSLDDEEFVTLLYNNVLDRAPDAGGLQAWLDALGSGTSRAQVVLGFSQSTEYIASSNDALREFVATVYADSADILDGGAQSDILFAGRGADTFLFELSDVGSDVIYGLDQFDTVRLEGFGYSSIDEALSNIFPSASGVVFSDRGVTITFANATIDDVEQTLDIGLLGSPPDESAKIALLADENSQPSEGSYRSHAVDVPQRFEGNDDFFIH